MLKRIAKIPAGTFLVPMIISMLLISFFPGMYDVFGGTTQAAFQNGTSVVIGFLVFAAGTTLDFEKIGPLLKRHLPMVVFKLILSTLYILAFYWLFGLEGIWGINLLTFACVIYSLNPAVALAIHSEYGDQQFGAVYGIYGILGMSFTPLILLSVLTASGSGSAGMDWNPIISIFIPLIVGAVLGNLDPDFADFFSPLIGKLLPFLGWNLGVGMNLMDAISSGLSGVLMAVLFMVLMLPLILFDKYVAKVNDGVDGVAIMNVGGVSVANPAIIGAALPAAFANQVTSATAIVMMVCIITSLVSPALAQKLSKESEDERLERELS
ncbi:MULTISPECIES: 2-keto-3-deoxygluconate permease [Aerococcus]|uniref:2-keto-3-deoxygluconate permease n=1 Tax=Aerococcus TaxID=1375 RepID=UPI0018A775F3|nr:MULTISPECIES: 2-keto-3-deoxygluconate permease [Aerococcus]MCY3035554.1 2-keto-3-deoxygluconate permease [Aerococcus sp. Group 2]MCY3039229.1 2-keto-3-deoxygluconate permease [Aerococcus sp. Group 2]MCY3041130.1 2-keto-3-deoxygluconate permease [Aerococcus sp. Group 2]MCY3042368.1 2-keto-3-deoxygluconate permease [Aerococcus sp. Group 2]MDK6521013.1 2-keto-3-deoxygluconate permease [Aerococcus urinae]